jgi:uncharacterized membrane protein
VGLNRVDYFVLLERHWRNCFFVVVGLWSSALDLILHHMDLEIGFVSVVVNLDRE